MELADKLRHASRQARPQLYPALYEELYRRVPTHPMLTRKRTSQEHRATVRRELKLLLPFLSPQTLYLEIGAGDCASTFEIAPHVRIAYALEVSAEISRGSDVPDNFKLLLTNGVDIPLPPASVDVVYSNQLMEHLHPDDAIEHLQHVLRILSTGGRFVCITPNRLNGPHDVSMCFDNEARGFHLKEYTTLELMRAFRSVGFRRAVPYLRVLGRFFPVPGFVPALAERVLEALPRSARWALGRRIPFRWLLGIQLIGIK